MFKFYSRIISILVTIPETVKIESDRSKRRQAYLCRTAFVIWLLPFLDAGQNRDRTLYVLTEIIILIVYYRFRL